MGKRTIDYEVTVYPHERLIRLYEQQGKKKAGSEELALIFDHYIKRWRSWRNADLEYFTRGSFFYVKLRNL